ncbi:hypothetical protein JW711_06395 [Candidatus Woesearchaeota archaeon]|nr:hypothetical protein [Candidatus Woesearchaeota archaeon]
MKSLASYPAGALLIALSLSPLTSSSSAAPFHEHAAQNTVKKIPEDVVVDFKVQLPPGPDEKEPRLVFQGEWGDAVRYMSRVTRQSVREHSYIYVKKEKKLFEYGATSSAFEIVYDNYAAQKIILAFPGEKYELHTHANFYDPDLVKAYEERLEKSRGELESVASRFCNLNGFGFIEDRVKDCYVPSPKEDLGVQMSPERLCETVRLERNIVEAYKRYRVINATLLPSGNDLYASMLIKLAEPGKITSGIIVSTDNIRIPVVWYDAAPHSDVESYRKLIHDALRLSGYLSFGKIDEIMKKAEDFGIKIRHEDVNH